MIRINQIYVISRKSGDPMFLPKKLALQGVRFNMIFSATVKSIILVKILKNAKPKACKFMNLQEKFTLKLEHEQVGGQCLKIHGIFLT